MKQNELGLLQSAASSHDFTFRNCQVLWGGGGGGNPKRETRITELFKHQVFNSIYTSSRGHDVFHVVSNQTAPHIPGCLMHDNNSNTHVQGTFLVRAISGFKAVDKMNA